LRDGNLRELVLVLVLLERISAILRCGMPRIVDSNCCHGFGPAGMGNCGGVGSQSVAVVRGRHLLVVGGAHLVDWRRPQAVGEMLMQVLMCGIVGESWRFRQGNAKRREHRSSRVEGE
jgi:hypothetical protein